jgi:hypothetical protein
MNRLVPCLLVVAVALAVTAHRDLDELRWAHTAMSTVSQERPQELCQCPPIAQQMSGVVPGADVVHGLPWRAAAPVNRLAALTVFLVLAALVRRGAPKRSRIVEHAAWMDLGQCSQWRTRGPPSFMTY